jgi:hypothetical protein
VKTVAAIGGAILVVGGVLVIVLTHSHLAWFDDSVTLGDALVAAGTLALAVVTFWLAWQTRREIGVSMKSIDLAREGIDSQDMPFVIAVPNPNQSHDLDTTVNGSRLWWGLDPDGKWVLRVRLWNIGKGPAIVRDVRLRFVMREFLDARTADVGEIVIGPGQAHDFTLPVEDGKPTLPPAGKDVTCVMRIYYSHIGGAEYMTASSALVGSEGVRPSNFTRQPSDGHGRSVILAGPSAWTPWQRDKGDGADPSWPL